MYPSSPAVIAETLHKIADHIAVVPDLDPAVIAASLSLQIHQSHGPQPTRIAAVKALAAALGMTDVADKGSNLYGTEALTGSSHDLGPVDVSVFTGVKSAREIQLERENERLRAQLASEAGEQS